MAGDPCSLHPWSSDALPPMEEGNDIEEEGNPFPSHLLSFSLDSWNYVMSRNIYAWKKRLGEVEKIKEAMRKFGGKREAGCSVIEAGSKLPRDSAVHVRRTAPPRHAVMIDVHELV